MNFIEQFKQDNEDFLLSLSFLEREFGLDLGYSDIRERLERAEEDLENWYL